MAFHYRHRCLNFPTLLACNTALSIFIYAVTQIASSIYMFQWDQYEVIQIDRMCSVRAYLHHCTTAWLHHSLLLQAIHRYCKIRCFEYLKDRRRKICLVLFQWGFDFMLGLPALLTGNMVKLPMENICFVTLTRLDYALGMAIVAYLLTDITLSVIYRSLVRHVQQVSARLAATEQFQIQRDLAMVRRIVLLNAPLVFVGIPILITVVLSTIRVDLMPNKLIRVLLVFANLPLSPLLIILFFMTPDLHQSLKDCRNKIRTLMLTEGTAPTQPVATIARTYGAS